MLHSRREETRRITGDAARLDQFEEHLGTVLTTTSERLVCGLYDLPHELTDAVVQHAIDRAAR